MPALLAAMPSYPQFAALQEGQGQRHEAITMEPPSKQAPLQKKFYGRCGLAVDDVKLASCSDFVGGAGICEAGCGRSFACRWFVKLGPACTVQEEQASVRQAVQHQLGCCW